MRSRKAALAALATFALSLPALCPVAEAQKLTYPVTKKVEQSDTYFGVTVADPYRWLEDDKSEETARWIQEQNRVTFGYLEKIPFRQKVKERLTKLYDYPKYSAPSKRAGFYLFSKNEGLQNQSVIYIQKGLDGRPEVLLDPNKFSDDGTTQLAGFALSKDGRYAAYGTSKGGSDWNEYFIMEVATRKLLPETIKWVKSSGIAWQGDGFYYSRYNAPEQGKELSAKNEFHKVYYHKVGTPQAEDELVYEHGANAQRFHNVSTTKDERFALLYVRDRSKGAKGNSLFFREHGQKEFSPVVAEMSDDTFTVVGNVGDRFIIRTNRGAPNGRVLLLDSKNPGEKSWKEILPERPEPIQGVSYAGGKLFVTYLKDVTTRAYVYDLNGKLENEVALPALGIAGGFGGEEDDREVFYTFTSLNFPPAIYRYDIAKRKSTLFRAAEIPSFDPSAYETRQVFYASKDGTRVPMFLVHKKGLKLDGSNPTLLTGYGGFNVTQSPSFSSLRIALLEQGFVYAVANIRGGGEYGAKWHEAGTKLRKQNVFDDFIAAAEYLIAQKYTSPERLAIQGGSNGGLLVGAVMNQRPELFRVVIPQAGVMDMLRFHKFTIGWNWVSDYGSSDNEAEFKALYAYSPLHNLRRGTKYPATFITTADHDDRVVPAHSYKYAAALQESQGGANPVLIRIDTKSGHGASSTTKAIEQITDIYSFLLFNMGVTPK